MNVCRAGLALVFGIAASLTLTACMTLRPPSGEPRPGIDHYRFIAGQARSTAGCLYHYRRFVPDVTDQASTLIVGHGFLRRQSTMTSLARALADAGFQTVTLDFCNMRPWNGHHRRNARDMLALAGQLRIEQPIYAGFSAGALAAMLATGDDPQAVGALLLDPVDQDELGARAAGALRVPVEALFGEPSACNAFQQAQAWVASVRRTHVTRIAGASHCEFEAPSNWLCELFCGDGQEPLGADRQQRRTVIEQAVKAARRLERSLDPTGSGRHQEPVFAPEP